MKIEIWAEVTCPWCGLGSHRLDRAAERFEHGNEVEVVHHSSPLSSSFPGDETFSVREALLRRHGMGGSQAYEFLAHASAEGKNRDAWDAIFRAYFGQARPVFSMNNLLDLSQEIGLDREGTRRALTEHRSQRHVRDDAARAQRLGATGAPFIVIDGTYGIPGAQDSDGLLHVLRTAWDASHPLTLTTDGDAAVCGPDGCAVPARN
ncbi:DsbA family protein [Streptomyces sp. NPDC101455]|uniref:DsbA family oxidoreductase n=1 Tax=Streptomyces sp. NPDC101455 TaxID=3366142 RepID=UPI0037FCE175